MFKLLCKKLYSPWNMLIYIFILGCCNYYYFMAYGNALRPHLLLAPLMGMGNSLIMGRLVLLILNGTPLYVFAGLLQEMLQDSSLFLEIRAKSRKMWTRMIIKVGLVNVFTYLLLFVLLDIIISAFTLNNAPEIPKDFLCLIMLRFLELCIYTFILIAAYTRSKKMIPGALLIIGLHLITLFGHIKALSCLPCALTSYSEVLAGDFPGYRRAFIELIILNIFLYALCNKSERWLKPWKQ